MPNSIEKASGDKQRAKPGEEVPEPVVVVVKDPGGNPVPNVPVKFAPKDGDPEPDPPESPTDSEGKAKSRIKLGPEPGKQKVRVKCQDGENKVTFRLFARETVGDEIEKVSGNRQEGPINQPLTQPLVVKVTTPAYQPVAGATITFTPQSGTCVPSTAVTNAAGQIFTVWTPGPEVLDEVKCVVTSPDTVNRRRFWATVWDPAQPRIVKTAGDRQTGAVDTELPLDLEVIVRDPGGNPIPNVPVEFEPEEGEVDPPSGQTDQDGKAKTKMKLGPDEGKQKVKVTSPTTANETTFTEFAE